MLSKYRSLLLLAAATAGLASVLVSGCSDGYSAKFDVPTATIIIDGDSSDWQRLKAFTSDPVGDANGPDGCDIEAVYIATDSQNLYIRIDVANGSPSTSLNYIIGLSQEEGACNAGDIYIAFDVAPSRCVAHRVGREDAILLANGQAVVSGSTIEMSLPLRPPVLPDSAYIYATSGTAAIDWIDYVAEGGLLSVF